MTIQESTHRFQMFAGIIQVQSKTMQTGPGGKLSEVIRPPQQLPVSFRWEMPDNSFWRPSETDRVSQMFHIVVRLAGELQLSELTDYFFGRMKELFPGRNLTVQVGGFVIENRVTELKES